MTTNGVEADSEYPADDKALLQQGLHTVRRRRWYLWLIILVYMPLMMTAVKFSSAVAAFLSWCLVMVVIVGYSALARCPRCGNYFHMHGLSMLYLRKCLHCQLHVCADKRL